MGSTENYDGLNQWINEWNIQFIALLISNRSSTIESFYMSMVYFL